MKISSLILFVLLFSFASFAQEFQLPADLPTTKEEFIKSEKDFIAAATWLETIAIGQQKEQRTKVNAWVTAWVINSPTVTIEVRWSITKVFDKNPQLLSVYMAGYAKYSLENNYDTDAVKCNMAGIRSAINCYNLGGDIKKNKDLSEVVDADKNGKLEDWVKEALNSKK